MTDSPELFADMPVDEQVRVANAIARGHFLATGHKIILYPSQWEHFERAGCDMSYYALAGQIPTTH